MAGRLNERLNGVWKDLVKVCFLLTGLVWQLVQWFRVACNFPLVFPNLLAMKPMPTVIARMRYRMSISPAMVWMLSL